jgi:hypothetical protein
MTSHQDISSENYATKHDTIHKDISQRQETKTSRAQIPSRDKFLQQNHVMISSRNLMMAEQERKSQQEFALRHTKNIKSHQTIIQQNATRSHKEIA